MTMEKYAWAQFSKSVMYHRARSNFTLVTAPYVTSMIKDKLEDMDVSPEKDPIP